VRLPISPHAAPASCSAIASPEGRASDVILALHAQAAQRDTDATAYQGRDDDVAAP
jgi:hypothetical protein